MNKTLSFHPVISLYMNAVQGKRQRFRDSSGRETCLPLYTHVVQEKGNSPVCAVPKSLLQQPFRQPGWRERRSGAGCCCRGKGIPSIRVPGGRVRPPRHQDVRAAPGPFVRQRRPAVLQKSIRYRPRHSGPSPARHPRPPWPPPAAGRDLPPKV